MKPIYLDYNATTPIDPRVADAMRPYLEEHFGNPSSGHYYGLVTREAVMKAREQVAAMLRCRPDEIIFTSGGSEANNHAIKGAAEAFRNKGNHIITSNIEHPAVTEVCRYLEKKKGCEITYLPVDKDGLIDTAQVRDAIRDTTVLITIMHANNEVGTIEPIAEIAAIAHKHKIIMHTDAAQSIGKIPVNVDELGVDLLSVAGHKLYAPKGIGALYVRRGLALEKQVHGAGQESGWRAGTENVLEIVGLGKAAQLISDYDDTHTASMKQLRDRLENQLHSRFRDISRVNGHPEKRLPNTSSISFRNIRSSELLTQIDNVAASAGAACHSDDIEISHVLEAMRIPLDYAMGTLRLSVGRFTGNDDIDRAVESISAAIEKNLESGGKRL